MLRPSKMEGPETPNEKALRILEDHVACLMVHFDTVRIFCTRHDGKITIPFTNGAGNYFAQMGQIREWVSVDEEIIRQNVRRDNG